MMKLSMAQIWVHDQDEARAFYTEKLGWEVRQDVTIADLGGFRFLTVGPPAQADISVALLLVPPPPIVEPDDAAALKSLVSKGKAGGLFLASDDVQADYELLRSRGVEFYEAPTQYPYGVDCGFHDPSGNSIRMAQIKSGWESTV